MPETLTPMDYVRAGIRLIPGDIRRSLADDMSDMRAECGPDLADKLEQTAPEERTVQAMIPKAKAAV